MRQIGALLASSLIFWPMRWVSDLYRGSPVTLTNGRIATVGTPKGPRPRHRGDLPALQCQAPAPASARIAASAASAGTSRLRAADPAFDRSPAADLDRIDAHGIGDVFQLLLANVADRDVEPRLHLPVGVLREIDRAGFGDAFEARGDIDFVGHQVAVAFLDDVAEMNADTELIRFSGGRPALRSIMPFGTRSRSEWHRRRCETR